MALRWAVGVTAVPARRRELLPATLRSLAAAGFREPRLFVDGAASGFDDFGLPVTYRSPALRVFGNWSASLWELFVRDPAAERFAIFQDDLIACKNLRAYLDRCRYPDTGNGEPHNGYINLYTGPSNAEIAPKEDGWFLSNQYGRGALALVFNREAVIRLLSTRSFVEKPVDPHRGWRCVDGAVVTALAQHGYKEFVHQPSLVQHVGRTSSMDKRQGVAEHDPAFPAYEWPERWQAPSFRGEEWDALRLLNR